MGFFDSLRISGSALTAERLRMDVIANNIANMETTRTAEGGPYRRQQVVFVPTVPEWQPASLANPLLGPASEGVEVAEIVEDDAPPQRVYQPDHPDADEQGYVPYPSIHLVNEVTDMLAATRAYKASVTALDAAKSMALKALEIGRA